MVVLLKTIRLLAATRHATGKPSLAPLPTGGTDALFHRHHGVGDRANTCQDARHGKRLATCGPGRPPPAEHAVLTKNVRSKKHVVPEKRSCGTHSFFRRFWVGPKCAFFLEVCEFCQNRHTVQYITRVGKAKKM